MAARDFGRMKRAFITTKSREAAKYPSKVLSHDSIRPNHHEIIVFDTRSRDGFGR